MERSNDNTGHRILRTAALSKRLFRNTEDRLPESPIKPAYNQPRPDFSTISVKEVAGIKPQSPFGFDKYEIPNTPM